MLWESQPCLKAGCGTDTSVLVCPSDHLIAEDEKFARAIEKGMEALSMGNIVIFGIVPNGPKTGFGYVRAGNSFGSWSEVAEFG